MGFDAASGFTGFDWGRSLDADFKFRSGYDPSGSYNARAMEIDNVRMNTDVENTVNARTVDDAVQPRTRAETNEGASCPIPSAKNSFSADTTVVTSNGDVPISELEEGDTVLAYNEETGETGDYTVTDTISHVDEIIVHLTIDGELIETTSEHPFYNAFGEWVEAGDLAIGERVWSLSGDFGTVESVEFVEANQPMYNLTVDEAHTFFVGDGEWLVHNSCDPLDPNLPAYQNGYGQAIDNVDALTGKTMEEAVEYLSKHPGLAKPPKVTPSGYSNFVFKDGSEIWLKPNGEVVRQPVRAYGTAGVSNPKAGPRVNSGVRYDPYTGKLYHSDDWHTLPQQESLVLGSKND